MRPPLNRLSIALGLILAANAAPVFAQAQADTTNPYYFGVNGGLTHLTNVFNLPNGADSGSQQSASNSDDVLSANLLGGVDTRFGREHLRLDGSVGVNRYRSNTSLNNVSYQGSAALDWSTLERISGTITAGASRQLASYNISPYLSQVPTFVKNSLSSDYVDAFTSIGVVTRWSLDTDVSYRQYRYSAVQYAQLNYKQTAFSLGPSYKANEDLRIGVDWRHTNATEPTYFQIPDPDLTHALPDGSQPIIGYDANHFSRNDIDLTVHWRFGGSSTLDTRLSHGSYTHADTSGQDSSNFSGAATWTWTPTGKLNISTAFIHDTGLNAAVYTQILTVDTSQSTVTNTLQSNASYQLTGKVSLTAGLAYARTSRSNAQELEFSGSAVNNSIDNSHDTYTSISLGANWQYSRGVSMSCQAGHQVRNSTLAFYSYNANSIGCNAQMLFY